MFKKFLSLLLAVMMVVSVMAVGVVTSNAATTDGFTPESSKLYFDVDGTGWTMGAKDKIAFYMAGGDFDTEANPTKPLAWGASKLIGTATANESGIFEIDPVAKLGYQFTPGVQYKIIFAQIIAPRNWGAQTCSLFFTTDCFGHVAYSDGTEMENDVDSTKKTKTVYWRDIDPEENGPVLAITSIGNVVGSCVEQGKTKYSLFVEFLSEAKTDFQNKTCYENAHKYKCEIDPSSAGYKSEQKLIDDIGAGLGLTKDDIKAAFEEDPGLIAQELMTGDGAFDLDADCYIDTVSKKPVAIFTKRKISTTIGGANKTISFKDPKLFSFLEEALTHFEFNGPIDVDVFYKNGEYYLSEVNPRFGGAYLHAYGAGVDFIKLIEKNVRGEANESIIGQYDENVVMLMYDSVVIKHLKEMP